MIRLVLLFAIVFAACNIKQKVEYGSLRGNVFWKYNDFVGNKPDAGSDVYLYSYSDTSLRLDAETDFRGDFVFDSIPTGYYFLVVRSKNTTEDPYYAYRGIKMYRKSIETIFKSDLSPVFANDSADLTNLQDARDNVYKMASSRSVTLKDMYKADDTLRNFCARRLENFPDKLIIPFMITGSYNNSLDLQNVTIEKGKTKTVVVDFGTTYY